jgi:hypothetical protein
MASDSREITFLTLVDELINALENLATGVSNTTGNQEARWALSCCARAREQVALLAADIERDA